MTTTKAQLKLHTEALQTENARLRALVAQLKREKAEIIRNYIEQCYQCKHKEKQNA